MLNWNLYQPELMCTAFVLFMWRPPDNFVAAAKSFIGDIRKKKKKIVTLMGFRTL